MGDERGVQVQGLVHWSIPVNDLDESREFYTRVLGMQDAGPVGKTMTCVQFGETKVLLCQRVNPVVVGGPRESPAHLAFRVTSEDFDRAAAEMASWGVTVRPPSGPPETIKDGVEHRHEGTFIGRSLYFDDPSGNRLELHDPF